MPSQKDVKEILGHIRSTKQFTVAKSGNQEHYRVLKRGGGAVIHPDGKPIVISSSPSEERFKEMTIKRLMEANVLTKDPYKATPTKGSSRDVNGDKPKRGSHLGSPEMQARKVAAIKAKSAKLNEETAHLRSRLEPIVLRLGGWSQPPREGARTSGIGVVDLAGTVYHWAHVRGRVELPKATTGGQPITEGTLRGPAQHVKDPGKTLGEKWLPLFQVFVDDLERNAGTPPDPAKAAARYWELYKEWKGMLSGPQSPAAGPPVKLAVVRADDVHEGAASVADLPKVEYEQIGPAYDKNPPSIALEAMFRMAQAPDADFDKLMAIGEKIARLELTERK